MFPKYKYKKGWLAIGKEPDGWEDLGLVGGQGIVKDGKLFEKRILCSTCLSRARVGKEKGDTFRFCPHCMIKIKD